MISWEGIWCNNISMIFSLNSRYYYYINEDKEEQRHTYNMTGIKFMFDTKGKGKQFSLEAFLLQIATLFSLLRLSTSLFDFIISWLLKGFEN